MENEIVNNSILNLQNMEQIMIASVIAIPLINGLIKIFITPHIEKINKSYIPAISVGFGIIVGVLVLGFSVLGLVGGVILGMASTGLYEFSARSVAKGVDDIKKI